MSFVDNKKRIYFLFITLIKNHYNKAFNREYKLNINMNVDINNTKTEKNSFCKLENGISLNRAGISQGRFICGTNLTDDEFNNLNITTISLSPNNDEVNGVSDLDEIFSNPYKTDEYIKDIKTKKEKGLEINELADIIDLYSETLNIGPTLDIESINIDDCQKNGKLYILGKLSENFTKETEFDLPLTYPDTNLKCELNKADKNTRINITCKLQTNFENIESIIIEPRFIKKKNKEILYIPGKEIKFNENKNCENYNTIKLQIAKKRQDTKYTFLQINQFNPKTNELNFDMALLRSNKEYEFNKLFNLNVTISNKGLLRILEEINFVTIAVSCNLNSHLQTDLAAWYNCSNRYRFSGTPLGMEIETDHVENISGIRENGNPDKLKSKTNYTNITNLEKTSDFPVVNITNINGDTCKENGQYIITAEIVENSNNINLKNQYENVEIRFSMPESSGLCKINISKNIMIMTCENREKFAVSQILIERNVVQDKEGNDLFIINSITNLEVFECDISYNSILISNDSNDITKTEHENKKHIGKRKNHSKGLPAIAIIIIVIIFVLVIFGILVLVIRDMKRKILSKKKKKTNGSPSDSDLNINTLS